jgi:hypothetical protein
MSRRDDKGRLPPFVPLDKEMMRSPAWRAMSYGARLLYVHLKWRWRSQSKNNGRLFISHRQAQEELGGANRDSISRWFRELQHYGFIVMTDAGGLGVDGKGRAPHFRLTEAAAPGGRNGDTWMLPTKDYLKWAGTMFQDDRGAAKRARKRKQNPGPQSEARVARKVRPGLARKVRPVAPGSGPQSEAIQDHPPGPQSEAISRSTTTRADARTVLLPWSTPTVVEVTDPIELAAIRAAIESERRARDGTRRGLHQDRDSRRRVIEALRSAGRPLTMPEVMATAKLSKGQATPLLHKLVNAGTARRPARGLYQLAERGAAA